MTAPSTRSFNSGTTSGTSHTVPMPGTIVAGDLLLIFAQSSNSVTPTISAGWTEKSAGANRRTAIFVKVAAGSDTATITTGASSGVAHVTMAVKDWEGTLAGVETADMVASINPGSITASWGALDNLFLELVGLRAGTLPAISAWSTNYTEVAKVTGDFSTDIAAGIARRSLTAASDDPDTATATGTPTTLVSYMVVVQPSPGLIATQTDSLGLTDSITVLHAPGAIFINPLGLVDDGSAATFLDFDVLGLTDSIVVDLTEGVSNLAATPAGIGTLTGNFQAMAALTATPAGIGNLSVNGKLDAIVLFTRAITSTVPRINN